MVRIDHEMCPPNLRVVIKIHHAKRPQGVAVKNQEDANTRGLINRAQLGWTSTTETQTFRESDSLSGNFSWHVMFQTLQWTK